MARLSRSKRVSWASGANLCKVRLFLSEDSPCQAGLGSQDHLQSKGSWLLHASGPGSDDSLPPGFESLQPANNFKIDISQIPLIKWGYPPNIMLNPNWRVVTGEESEEIAIQNERMLGALEAIYPRPSNIPPNPFVSPDLQDSRYDDSQTPSVPLTPIEDDDASDQLEAPQLNASANCTQSDTYVPAEIRIEQISSIHSLHHHHDQPQHHIGFPVTARPLLDKPAIAAWLSAEPDVSAAASAAFTAIMRSSEEGSMIDRDLLIKILSDPAQIERLLTEYGTSKQAQSVTTSVAVPMAPLQMILCAPASSSEFMAHCHISNSTNAIPAKPLLPRPPPPPPAATSTLPSSVPLAPMNPAPSTVQPLKDANFANASPKDIHYYKSLIQQHGGKKREAPDRSAVHLGDYHDSTLDIGDGSKVQGDSKPKVMKPCAYFNSAKGCRNGSSCLFLHDASAPRRIEQQKGSKKIKLDNRIVGRN